MACSMISRRLSRLLPKCTPFLDSHATTFGYRKVREANKSLIIGFESVKLDRLVSKLNPKHLDVAGGADDSYAQAQLVLKQCFSSQPDGNSKGMVLLAMSTLSYERCQVLEAIEKLQKVQELNVSCMGVRVAATEALVGLHLELGQEGIASALADVCIQLIDTIKLEIGNGHGFDVPESHIKTNKGLIELVSCNLKSAEAFFDLAQDGKSLAGNVALSYGEFLHAKQNFVMAKESYEKVLVEVPENKEFNDPFQIAACNNVSEEVLLAATCSLGLLEAQLGNFADAEEILTRALTRAEQQYGSHHPKVGVVLTCIALMFRHKATLEHSSSLLIQEGLYRRAIELLKAPPLENGGVEGKVHRGDILALARGLVEDRWVKRVKRDAKASSDSMDDYRYDYSSDESDNDGRILVHVHIHYSQEWLLLSKHHLRFVDMRLDPWLSVLSIRVILDCKFGIPYDKTKVYFGGRLLADEILTAVGIDHLSIVDVLVDVQLRILNR